METRSNETSVVEQLDTCAKCGRDPGRRFYFANGNHYCEPCAPRRVPRMDWNCREEHEILRTGPAFAMFHVRP